MLLSLYKFDNNRLPAFADNGWYFSLNSGMSDNMAGFELDRLNLNTRIQEYNNFPKKTIKITKNIIEYHSINNTINITKTFQKITNT